MNGSENKSLVAVAKNLGFGAALLALQRGHKVRRVGWNGKNMFLILIREYQVQAPLHGEVDYMSAWLGMRTAQRGFVPWVASQSDLLDSDWEVLE